MVGISRSRYYQLGKTRGFQQRTNRADEDELVARIKIIKLDHPYWGYRRVWAWLTVRDQILVNKKRVYRIMKSHGLLVNQIKHRATRTPQRQKPRAERPRQYWGIDMTKFMIPSVGWIYLVIVLDWYSKKIVGWSVSLRSRTVDWKQALEMAVGREFPQGVRDQGLSLISDNGSQPTSTSFMKDMATLGIQQIFTSYDNPRGNADTERMIRTIKEDCLWINEFSSIDEAALIVDKWIHEYNKMYVHSSLGYKSPEEYEMLFNSQEVFHNAA